MMPTTMRPGLGRIVHYVENGFVFAAMIINIHREETSSAPSDRIGLVFWNPKGFWLFRQQYRDDVAYSTKPLQENKTWFWPPIAKPNAEEMKKLASEINKIIPQPPKPQHGRLLPVKPK